ncbi:N-acetylmuramoyl-L-alanine amidase [Aphanothece sacrum FPU1]|uniref:N-acetylmuramoyl-L-alanine amidase n=1 Tax=Aphanothece sacrum FPU1 TaxID=1920663 RepID=A0A401IJK6_APHSA|nr:N-acetylmuramoyl-L-alanine amidase [Aphanothece sacrum]GBF81360.1 N-acetylmuramoyl-L-alanine amidase [Aphanothece sacrum FPU1]GBF86119.1 N-acetylmuramoyl-L-alanine amidase [Aphanothece sacrum FPU3]
MKAILGLTLSSLIMVETSFMGVSLAQVKPSLSLVYPPNNHQTNSDKIFLIGTASPQGEVIINEQRIERSKAGHFAPSFPLKLGENKFNLRYNNETINVTVNRVSSSFQIPQEVAFADNSLLPNQNITRLTNELVCFSAIAAPDAKVSVKIADQNIALLPGYQIIKLPANSAILTDQISPIVTPLIEYQGCTKFLNSGQFNYPIFQLTLNNKTITQTAQGTVEIIERNELEIIEISNSAIIRTGPSSEHSRLTPLPKGTLATVTGKEGEWLRLDYGAWVNKNETKLLPITKPPHALIRGIKFQSLNEATKIIFPLDIPVPMSVKQESNRLILTLHNTTAETDTIKLDYGPYIKHFSWQQINPNAIEYTLELNSDQQWGYELNYEGTNLIFTLRHPPKLNSNNSQSLQDLSILLDPGHGGKETGAIGPTGYPEKNVNLRVSQLLKQELLKMGATVYMTRETDQEVSLNQRVELINKLKPTIAISIHYNALPDEGDAMNTKGIGVFWYHPQAENISKFLHNYLVEKANRPSYGVFWNNLALTRPHTTPAILLELGFMINPTEFEWVTNPQEQEKLAQILANGIREWFTKVSLK